MRSPGITAKTGVHEPPATAWRPGQSGNPSGRPRKTQQQIDLETACKAKAPAALRVLTELMKSADKDSVRLHAALAVLDRAFGKPVSREERGDPGDFATQSMTRSEIKRSIAEKAAKLGIKFEFTKEWDDER